MISLFSTNSIFFLPWDAWRIDHLRQVRRVDQKLTRRDGPAAAYSGRHDCNLSRLAIEDARHDAIVAVVVGGLPLRRSMSQSSRSEHALPQRSSQLFSTMGKTTLIRDTLSRQTFR
jgi:hypothetical protein